jgi:hypothetical protein
MDLGVVKFICCFEGMFWCTFGPPDARSLVAGLIQWSPNATSIQLTAVPYTFKCAPTPMIGFSRRSMRFEQSCEVFFP